MNNTSKSSHEMIGCKSPFSPTRSVTWTPPSSSPKFRGSFCWSHSFPPTPSCSPRRTMDCNRKKIPRNKVIVRFVWNLTSAMIHPVPKYYPLEHSSIWLDDIALNDISLRITTFMRINSISCKYGSQVANIECTTPTLIRFQLNLWNNGKQNRNEPASSVILEVQRLEGSSLSMSHVRNSLFHAVRTGEQVSDVLDRSLGSITDLVDESLLQRSTDDTRLEAVQLTLKLLESPLKDTNMLGMESLASLSNPLIVFSDVALAVSDSLIFGKNDVGHRLQKVICPYFEHATTPHSLDDADCSSLHGNSCFNSRMHSLVLQVLVKSLEVALSNKQSEIPNNVDTESQFWRKATSSFVQDLSRAHQNPQEAANAAKCLSLLIDLTQSSWLRKRLQEQMLPEITRANAYGKTRHLNLETSTETLMCRLMEAC